MVEFTFFEVHLNDPQLTANAPFSNRSKDVSASDEPLEEAGSSKGSAVAALVGLVFLVTVAFLAKRKLGGGGDDVDVEETVDVGGVEA